MIGGYFDRYHADWDDEGFAWFERLLDEDDVDVMAWALKTQAVPAEYDTIHMQKMQKLDYVRI